MRPAHWLFEFRNCRGYRYLYLVQKARTPKGPRNVRQIYLGTADSVFRRLNRPSPPLKSFPFGLSAALLKAAEETGLLASLERRLSPEAMAAAAQLITLQILGRAEKPLSREGMDRWYPTSGLPLLFPAPRSTNGDNLRQALRLLFDTGRRTTAEEPILSRARVHAIEEDVFRTLLQRGLHPRYLIFDGTNFFAYHRGDRWFARGRSKECPLSHAQHSALSSSRHLEAHARSSLRRARRSRKSVDVPARKSPRGMRVGLSPHQASTLHERLHRIG
jgi:hypothetical protein